MRRGRHSLDSFFKPRSESGTTDIDISAYVYTGLITLLTVTAPPGGLEECVIDLDVNKATTGIDAVATASDTLNMQLQRKIDGTNYRTVQAASQITLTGTGTTVSGVQFKTGPLEANESVVVKVMLSAERADAEVPYKVTYLGETPTITAIAAG